MNNLSSVANLVKALKLARRSARLSQDELAERIQVSRDLIVRMERGDNVGIHHLLAAANQLGFEFKLDYLIPKSAEIIKGSFDEWYQLEIRSKLDQDLSQNPGQHRGMFKLVESSRIKVVNWKSAANI